MQLFGLLNGSHIPVTSVKLLNTGHKSQSVRITASDLASVSKISDEGLQYESNTLLLHQHEATTITVMTHEGVPKQVYGQQLAPSYLFVSGGNAVKL